MTRLQQRGCAPSPPSTAQDHVDNINSWLRRGWQVCRSIDPTWPRQLERDYNRWESATTRLWNENAVVALYLRWAHQQDSLREMVDEHLRRTRLIYGSTESYRVQRTGDNLPHKRQRRDTIP